VLLIAPPLTEPGMANLAIEILAGQARQRGHHAETLHAALLQPKVFFGQLIHGLASPGAFTPTYFGVDPVDHVDQLIGALRIDFPRAPEDWDALADTMLYCTGEAERCVRDILAEIPAGKFDVIGFSVGFDAQKMPAAAIARKLRERGEQGVFVVGGTGTDGPMGPAYLENFPEFDLCLQGEVDDSWPLLLDRIAAGADPDDVPGCILRRDEVIMAVPEAPVSDTFLTHPTVDYADYIAQRDRSRYHDRPLVVLLETSRGCWWGEKHHCTFCGIRNVDFPYRSRAGSDTVQRITDLYDTYKPALVYCTDSIAPVQYQEEVWPALAEARQDPGRNWKIFYETKSNLRRKQIAALAAAGVTTVQPGIESFSSPSLKLMDKGSTGLKQVCFVKWATAYGVRVTYGIITGMPGESAADLKEMTAKAGKLTHLQPPVDVTRLVLHRFSPHFENPVGFGLEGVRPFHAQRVIYRCADERLMRMCYQLWFTVPGQDQEFYDAKDELSEAVERWQTAYQGGSMLSVTSSGDNRAIVRISGDADLGIDVVTDPVETLVLDSCAEVTSLGKIAHMSGTPVEDLIRAAARLEGRGLLLTERGSALSLPLPSEHTGPALLPRSLKSLAAVP
jgi:ribosomal peptide maturation radical SAM protein 1